MLANPLAGHNQALPVNGDFQIRSCGQSLSLSSISLALQSPTTVEQDVGSITIQLGAQDASGVDHAELGWLNPAGNAWSHVFCQFNGSETCTLTELIDSGVARWSLAGDYTNAQIIVYDVNGIYRVYYGNGSTFSPNQSSGSHGFSIPDLIIE